MKQRLRLVWLIALLVYEFQASTVQRRKRRLQDVWDPEIFPETVPEYNIRKDFYTNEAVSFGRIALLSTKIPGGPVPAQSRVSSAEFKRILQCPRFTPDLNGDSGILHILKLVPTTRDILKAVCAWMETGCENWKICQEKSIDEMTEATNGNLDEKDLQGKTASPYQTKLLRVINGTLFYDWPWGRGRFDKKSFNYFPILWVLERVKDLGNSVFFMAEEIDVLPYLSPPYNIPIPLFSYSPKIGSNDMPWMWSKPYLEERSHYDKIVIELERDPSIAKSAITPAFVANIINVSTENRRSKNDIPWAKKIPKAAFTGGCTIVRQIVFDIALTRPDLLSVTWTGTSGIRAWNPSSREPDVGDNLSYFGTAKNASAQIGYLQPLLGMKENGAVLHDKGSYKYLIVMSGHGGYSTADRLLPFLLYSGSTVLMAVSDRKYHFSMRIKPWVHYVPLAYNGADIVEKIEWLKSHDDLAKRIAENGRNFGKSYLRFEDYLCYTHAALETISALQNGSDVHIPFDARPAGWSF